MLATGTPQQFAEWQEFAALEPWGDDWERSSLIAARTINSVREIAAGFGGSKLSEDDFYDDDVFVPKRKKHKPTGFAAQLTKAINTLEGMRGFQ